MANIFTKLYNRIIAPKHTDDKDEVVPPNFARLARLPEYEFGEYFLKAMDIIISRNNEIKLTYNSGMLIQINGCNVFRISNYEYYAYEPRQFFVYDRKTFRVLGNLIMDEIDDLLCADRKVLHKWADDNGQTTMGKDYGQYV
jgi:hypothetical protein